jgi:hypothetical protein
MLTSALRVMSFGSMAMLDLGRVDFQVEQSANVFDADDASGTGEFFEKASLVLFNFPDFCCVSAYVLLLVVWAETYLKSRRHWYSSFRFRKVWMLGYFIFNIILYVSQLIIYSMLLLPSVDKYYETSLMYLTLAAFNLVLPILWLILYLYLAIVFSGFPFSTASDKLRLRILSQLGMVWTFARLGWGLAALTSVLRGWLVEASRSRLFYSLVLVTVFLVVEIIPVIFSLQENVLQSLSERDLTAFAMKQSDGQDARLEADFHRFSEHNQTTQSQTNSAGSDTKISPSGYVLDTEQYHNDEDTGLLQHRLLMTPSDRHSPTAPTTPGTGSGQDKNTLNTSFEVGGAVSWLFGSSRIAPPILLCPETGVSSSQYGSSLPSPAPAWDQFRTSFTDPMSAQRPPLHTVLRESTSNVISYQQNHSVGTSSSAPIPIPVPSSNRGSSSRIGSLESARDSFYTASPGIDAGFSPRQSAVSGSLNEDQTPTNFWRSLIGF